MLKRQFSWVTEHTFFAFRHSSLISVQHWQHLYPRWQLNIDQIGYTKNSGSYTEIKIVLSSSILSSIWISEILSSWPLLLLLLFLLATVFIVIFQTDGLSVCLASLPSSSRIFFLFRRPDLPHSVSMQSTPSVHTAAHLTPRLRQVVVVAWVSAQWLVTGGHKSQGGLSRFRA